MTSALLALLLAAYDPLAVGTAVPQVVPLTLHDGARSRDIPLRVYLPEVTAPAPVLLFSHGLGGSAQCRGIPLEASPPR